MKENIIAYIQDKKELNSVSQNELKSFLLKYPFCQTARLLYLKNVYQQEIEQFQKEFPISGLFIGDKKKLYIQLNKIESIKPEEIRENITIKENLNTENSSEILSFEENQKEPIINIPMNKEELNQTDENMELLDFDVINQKNENSPDSLIDNFIVTNPRLVPIESNEANKDISVDSVVETDGIYTEKLAKIYMLQKNYIKAIEVYQKLSLKIPEKNTYFAEQIEIIKRNLN